MKLIAIFLVSMGDCEYEVRCGMRAQVIYLQQPVSDFACWVLLFRREIL
jgi:hypothetical protein